MLNERNRAVLLAVKTKSFEGLAIKPAESRRYKTEADAMSAWQKLKSECVLTKKAR